MTFEILFFAVFAGVVIFFVSKYLRHGSLTGAMLGGAIEQTLAEIPLEGGKLLSQTLKVYEMRSPDGAAFIGISVVSKAPLAASMVPYRLSISQARELGEILSSTSG